MPKVKEKLSETWDKFYTVYMFDEIKYHKLCKEQGVTNRHELKKQCYVLDDDGKRIYLGDENHIFRIKNLHSIQMELANYCKDLRTHINYWEGDCSESVVRDYYTLFYERYDKGTYTHGKVKPVKKVTKSQLSLFDIETPQNEYRILNAWEYYAVELNNTWQLSIKERVLLHLEVLRLCKKGMSLEDACKNVLAIHRKEDVMK